jgi:hypothetical protein
VKSVASTFGRPFTATEPEECTFIGSEGIARATRERFEVLRFADASTLLVCPIKVHLEHPNRSPSMWSWLDARNNPLFHYREQGFGMYFAMHAEAAFSTYLLPQCRERIQRADLRFWTGAPCYVHLGPDYVEVQQLGRRDVVPPKDVTVSMEDNGFELVLRAPQFYEARFLMGEVTNRMLLQMCLKSIGATLG